MQSEREHKMEKPEKIKILAIIFLVIFAVILIALMLSSNKEKEAVTE